jgi:uncharacterized protein YecT (DUF1311 family)
MGSGKCGVIANHFRHLRDQREGRRATSPVRPGTAMKPLPLALLAGLLLSGLAAPEAAARFCRRLAQIPVGIPCGMPEVMRLDEAVDAALARATAGADPLTALLLKRDQRWFEHALGPGVSIADGELKRLSAALQRRLTALERGDTRPTDLAGAWFNAFNDMTVEAMADGTLRVEMISRIVYAESDSVAGCSARAELKRDDEGWFTGTAINTTDGATPADNPPFKLRLRRQAGTLRVVLTHDEQDSFCGRTEQLTGSYFPIGIAAAQSGKAAAQITKPSFDCATVTNLDEQEICADPALAKTDREIAQAYRNVLRRVDATLAGHLRADQRAWVKANTSAFEVQLNPAWNKETSTVHHTGNAREELELRLNERLAMLTNFDARRKGLAGLWFAHNALLAIEPRDAANDGSMRALGRKWDSSDYKARCDFEASGRLVRGTFETTDSFPDLARDGATLVIGGKERTQPDYCSRMKTSNARLFPVKPGARIDLSDGRIR